MSRPRSISGSAGSRIRVILGETGSDYLYALDEDNGSSHWQTSNWSVESGGPPSGLCCQINNMTKKGRYITSVDFDMSGQWFVAGKKRDGSGAHSWWGGTSGTDAIKKSSATGKVYFGDHNEFGASIWVVLDGDNGYATNGIDIGSHLYLRMKRINGKKKRINFIRCFNLHGHGPGYFISDDEGSEWLAVGTHLSNELKNGGGGRIHDVAVARDGSWVVIRENSFVSSTGVASELTNALQQFYRSHRQRQASRSVEIRSYDIRIKGEREAEARQKEKARLEAEQKAKAEENARLEAAQKAKAEAKARELIKRQCDDADNFRQIRAKRLKPMERVTAIGFSSEPGDAIVKKIMDHGSVEVIKPLHPEEHSFVIKDPKLLTSFYAEQDTTEMTLFCHATDKYEAAVSLYHCVCYNGVCRCAKIASANFLPESVLSNPEQGLSTRPPPRLVIENGDGSSPLRFDEYRCPEKISMTRLKEIALNLKNDSNTRARWIDELESKSFRDDWRADGLKVLQRCHALEEIVNSLISLLKGLPTDNKGCVTYEVNYEHRDSSGRGRLFAVGETVKLSDSKYPRTATLQGMQSDLRAALVGSFAHDIDCSNSEVRLICSLALQLGLKNLIPKIFDYRDNRCDWLRRIEVAHGISESDAKRLVNIIMSGGRYETWLKSFGKSAISSSSTATDIKKFCFKLYAEIAAFRDQLLQHPRFKWTEVEREKLKRDGRPPGSIDSALMPRIVQCCENEVLGIIHRTFIQNNWVVRAKVFDGLIVEPGPGICRTLAAINKEAEDACRCFGWDIHLVEKPLHGETKLPVTIENARSFINRLSAHK